jgi:hypothetical protein
MADIEPEQIANQRPGRQRRIAGCQRWGKRAQVVSAFAEEGMEMHVAREDRRLRRRARVEGEGAGDSPGYEGATIHFAESPQLA